MRLEDPGSAQAGSYTVTVSNAEGSVTSSPATLTVTIRAPQLISQPGTTELSAFVDDELTFFSRIRIIGDELTLEWRKDGQVIDPGERTWPYFEYIQKTDAGSYQLFASNSVGSAQSKVFTLEVLDHVAPVFTTQPRSLTAPLGTRQELLAVIDGTSSARHPLVLQWYHDGVPVPLATWPYCLFETLVPSDAGTYVLRASNFGFFRFSSG